VRSRTLFGGGNLVVARGGECRKPVSVSFPTTWLDRLGARLISLEPVGRRRGDALVVMVNRARRAVPYDDCEAEGALAWTCESGSFKQ
jgi:hypothetical protein